MGIDVNKQNMEVVKTLFKRHVRVSHVSDLSDEEYRDFITEVSAIMASEWGFELPDDERRDMREFLKLIYQW